MAENIFDGMSQEEVKIAMDILYILSDANKKRIQEAYERRWEEEERKREEQRKLEETIGRAIGDF